MRLITILFLWPPVLTFLFFKGIPGEDNPFHVGYNFKKRHIRQGDCTGIYDRNVWQSFRENLKQTASAWPEFKVNRQRNTFILSRHKSDEEIAECISRLVYVNGPGRQGSFQATMDVDVKIQEFKTTCKFPDIQLAVINKIEWKNENVRFNSCECGEANFTVSYYSNSNTIHHFVTQQDWQESEKKSPLSSATASLARVREKNEIKECK